jgi:transcriptional regulator with XRE-family HTH domain
MIDKNFAARIRSMRREANLTQQGLADVLGADRTTVARWELGITAPAPYVIDLIKYKLRMQGYIK